MIMLQLDLTDRSFGLCFDGSYRGSESSNNVFLRDNTADGKYFLLRDVYTTVNFIYHQGSIRHN